jgi:hypothetical protein
MRICLNRRWRIGGWAALGALAGGGGGASSALGAAAGAAGSMASQGGGQAAASAAPSSGGFDISNLLNKPAVGGLSPADMMRLNQQLGSQQQQQQNPSSLDLMRLLQ